MNAIYSPVFRHACLCLLVSCLATKGNGQNLFGTNLILNGDAEEGAASTGGDVPGGIVSVPHWVTTGDFTANAYGQRSSTHQVPLDAPGPVARGGNYFAGGPTASDSFAIQEVDVSAGAAQIDSGVVQYLMAGYFGGFHHQNDNAVLTATFLTAAGAVLGTNTIGHVLSVDRSDNTSTGSLLLRKTQGVVPTGTRKIQFLIDMTLDTTVPNQSYNDGYADNLSFVLFSPSQTGNGLSILSTNGVVLVRWPTGLTGFALQGTSDLQPPITWSIVTNSIGVAGAWFVYTNTPSTGSQCFRLAF